MWCESKHDTKRGDTRRIGTKGDVRKHEKTKHTVGMKGNEKRDKDEVLRMTHINCSSPSPMLSMVHSVVWQGARHGLWLAMRSGGEERTETMK